MAEMCVFHDTDALALMLARDEGKNGARASLDCHDGMLLKNIYHSESIYTL